MVEESEKFKADDEKQKERIDAKNGLESYCSNIKDKLDDSERKVITDKCKEAIEWLEKNQTAEVEEFKDKQKELESAFNPIIKKLYGDLNNREWVVGISKWPRIWVSNERWSNSGGSRLSES